MASDRITQLLFGMKRPAHERRAQSTGTMRDGQQRRADHREGLGEGERMEEFALLPGQREDRHEREDDDDHREEDRPPNLLRGVSVTSQVSAAVRRTGAGGVLTPSAADRGEASALFFPPPARSGG